MVATVQNSVKCMQWNAELSRAKARERTLSLWLWSDLEDIAVNTFLTNSSAAAPSSVPAQSVTIYHRISTPPRTNEGCERQLRLVELDLRDTERSRVASWGLESRRRVEEEEEEEDGGGG